MKATLIKVDSVYHLWLNPNTKDKEHIASDNPIVDTRGVDLRKYKLSKQNCDEIFGVVTPEAMMRDIESNCEVTKEGFIVGFQTAMLLIKDKQFTLEDVRKAIAYGENFRDMDEGKVPYQTFVEFIQSLQRPTEIEVEVEMETKKQLVNGYENQPDNVVGFVAKYKYILVPKLDEDGCLILKKL